MDDEDDLRDCWAIVRSHTPRPPEPWGDVLTARLWKEHVVVINGPPGTRERALRETQKNLSEVVAFKPCSMLDSPHASISKAWLVSDDGVKQTLLRVFSYYEFVNNRMPVRYYAYEGHEGEVPALLHYTLMAAKVARVTWTVETGREYLYFYWDQNTRASQLDAAERLAEFLGMRNASVETDLSIARLMNFLYLANKVKNINTMYLAFDNIDHGNRWQLRTIETLLKLVQEREDLFGCFALVLGWSGEDEMLNRCTKLVLPALEAALNRSISVH